MRAVNGMFVLANKKEILDKLIENRKTHSQIVSEARKGYVEKAKNALTKKLDDLEKGKIVELTFDLYAPQDYTNVYDVAIRMLEIHTEETIKLSSEQIKCLVMDQWDWTSSFLTSNSAYSETARKFSNL